jgi:uncharacterized protein YbaR (Trm112 family)
MPISQELLDILACPKCKARVVLQDDQRGFICATCRLVYPIVDDIPNFLIDEALPLDEGPGK